MTDQCASCGRHYRLREGHTLTMFCDECAQVNLAQVTSERDELQKWKVEHTDYILDMTAHCIRVANKLEAERAKSVIERTK